MNDKLIRFRVLYEDGQTVAFRAVWATHLYRDSGMPWVDFLNGEFLVATFPAHRVISIEISHPELNDPD